MKSIIIFFIILLGFTFLYNDQPFADIYVKSTSITASKDGRFLYIGDEEGNIHQWDIASKKILKSIKAHNHKVSFINMSKDDNIIVSSGFDNTIVVININKSWHHEKITDTKNPPTTVLITSDNKNILYGSSNGVLTLWDYAKKEPQKVFCIGKSVITSISTTKDTSQIFAGTSEGIIHIIDTNTNNISILNAHDSVISSLITIEQDKILVSSSWDRSIAYWDIDKKSIIKRCVGHDFWVTSISLFDKNIVSAGSFDNTLKIWKVLDCNPKKTIKDNKTYISSAVFSGDGLYLFSLSIDGVIKQWDVNTFEVVNTLFEPSQK